MLYPVMTNFIVKKDGWKNKQMLDLIQIIILK